MNETGTRLEYRIFVWLHLFGPNVKKNQKQFKYKTKLLPEGWQDLWMSMLCYTFIINKTTGDV